MTVNIQILPSRTAALQLFYQTVCSPTAASNQKAVAGMPA